MPELAEKPAQIPLHYKKAKSVDEVRKSRNIIILGTGGERKAQGDYHLLKTDPAWQKQFKKDAERKFINRLKLSIELGRVWYDPQQN